MMNVSTRLRIMTNIRKSHSAGYYWRALHETDKAEICSWIKTRDALRMVSDDGGGGLSEKTLNSWVQKSICCIICVDFLQHKPCGFLTLSVQEASGLPDMTVELCHLILSPRRDFFSIASYLCEVAKIEAKNRGFSALVGRVVPWNRFGLSLARSQGFKKIRSLERWTSGEFIWHQNDIAQNSRASEEGKYGYGENHFQAQDN